MTKNLSDDLTEATDQARQVLVELHGMLKDLKRERQEVKAYLTTGATVLVQLALKVELESSLETITRQYSEVLGESTDRHEANWRRVLDQLEDVVARLAAREGRML